MNSHRLFLGFAFVGTAILAAIHADAQFVKGSPAPEIAGVDLQGKAVRLSELVKQEPYLVILFFFTEANGEDIALKLQHLQATYGPEKFQIVALGMEEDAKQLADFALRMGITYHVLDPATLEDPAVRDAAKTLPLTVFVRASEDKTVEQVLAGGGASTARLMATVAENLFRQRKAEALPIVEEAVKDSAEPSTKELKGFILAGEGKLDEAEQAFGEIDSAAGLAKVAYERGDTAAVVANAEKAPDNAYASALKQAALAREGKLDTAATTPPPADSGALPEWQQSEALNLQGRVAQTTGNLDQAVVNYQQAVALDPYNVIALSNEGAARRESGDLKGAQEVLEKAVKQSGDPAASMMLKQVVAELSAANDTRRGELIRSQIADLGARYKEMQASGAAAAVDNWSTRPLVMAFLPASGANAMTFDRAGMDQLILHELEARVQSSGKAAVVERAMLDQLLQELNLGSSELASGEVQRRLGKVLSAEAMGFVTFVRTGGDVSAYLRLVDTETTSIALQASEKVVESNPEPALASLAARVINEYAAKRELKGLIADASSDEAVLINLGTRHGVSPGTEFTVLAEGEPVEVSGRVIAHRQTPVGKISVTEAQEDYAVCKVVNRRDGAVFEKEMKIKESAK